MKTIRMITFVPALLVLLLSVAAQAQIQGPDPALTPEEVVSIQLGALQNNDDPEPDAGIAQTFALAHPSNQAVTGPLERFGKMIRLPAYAPLIGHRTHTIERLTADDQRVRMRVVIELQNGKTLQYLWEVRRVLDGPNSGAWLTTVVSNPVPGGQSI